MSFDLHQELAKELGLQGYRRLPTLSVAPGSRQPSLDLLISKGQLPAWLDGDVSKASLLDDPGLARRSMGLWCLSVCLSVPCHAPLYSQDARSHAPSVKNVCACQSHTIHHPVSVCVESLPNCRNGSCLRAPSPPLRPTPSGMRQGDGADIATGAHGKSRGCSRCQRRLTCPPRHCPGAGGGAPPLSRV